jgi:beta-lactamase superfamily II metal-dependent hydrolase
VFVDNDLATVWPDATRGGRAAVVLYRGDEVEVLAQQGDWTQVGLGRGRTGWVHHLTVRATGLLELAFIDVGQGDACLLTTPERRMVLIDGGENQLASRYLAARFGGTGRVVVFDAIVVTHGDADHFEGLSHLVEAAWEMRPDKCIRIEADRVFHNGLVKRPSSMPDRERLGPPLVENGRVLVPLVGDPRTVTGVNKHFVRWQAALTELASRRPTEVRRLDVTTRGPFSFLDSVRVDVLGPCPYVANDGSAYLEMLGGSDGEALSAAHTINGHSLVLMATYGNVSALLTGDIHSAAQRALVKQHKAGTLSLGAIVLKVPHHGSDDVSREFIEAAQPLVSVISAGDEDARRDYLHPRANLLGLLGRAARGAEPVIFVTNLSAFDRWAGRAFHPVEVGGAWVPDTARGTFYARERTAYGIVHVRTDGCRLLVARRGARRDRIEAYSYEIDTAGRARGLTIDRV